MARPTRLGPVHIEFGLSRYWSFDYLDWSMNMMKRDIRTSLLLLVAAAAIDCDGSAVTPGGGGDDADAAPGDDDGRAVDGGGGADGGRAPDAGGAPLPTADFEARCGAPGVVRCVGFDTATDIAGTFGDASGTLPGTTTPALDAAVKASGASSLLFTVPASTGPNSSGSYFTNFSDDLSVQFDDGDTFYVQWRQRFSDTFVDPAVPSGGGWKQAIIGTGDQPGTPYSSCTALEVVTQHVARDGFPILYNSCTGSASHGPYDGFAEPFGGSDYKLQNARPAPYCLYSQGHTDPPTFFPPEGNCFGYVANEWMTYQIEIQIGSRSGGEFVGSHVRMWAAREGQPSEQLFDWGPYNLTAGPASENQRYGKIWLLPYNGDRDPDQPGPIAHTWYDELIVSRDKIPDPN
jgi:hypothetical protein